MGASIFKTVADGSTAREAFGKAVQEAQWEHGHGGYSGTIAEKHSFVMIRDDAKSVAVRYASSGQTQAEWVVKDLNDPDPVKQAHGIAEALMYMNDRRITDKWGPAGCIDLGNERWLFFGWASE